MAKETAYEKQVREAMEALPEIVKATQVEPGYIFTNFKVHSHLVAEGFVEVREDLKNEAGDEATRATQKGIEKVMSETVNETPVEVNEFAIVDIAIARSRGTRIAKYPFDKLAVGQSFFIAGGVAKKLASTVCNAMKKHDVPDLDVNGIQKVKDTRNPKTGEIKENVLCFKHTVKFTCIDVKDGAQYGRPGVSGVAVGRTV